MSSAQLIPAILAPLIAWRFYRRFRQSVGRQKLRPARMMISVGIMISFLTIFVFAMLHLGISLWPLAGGLTTGGAIGLIGHKLTRFEVIDGEKFYTPNAYLGIAVSMLLIARVAYRFSTLSWPANTPSGASPVVNYSPLTLVLFGLTLGYYICYISGVLISLKAGLPIRRKLVPCNS